MSHYLNITTMIRDPKALIAALCRCGFKENQIEMHENAVHLYGYMGKQRAQKANVVIRRQYVGPAANDIGFERQSDGTYAAHISEYDHGKYGDPWQNKLFTYYGVEKTKAELTKKRIKFTEDVDEQNRPRIKARLVNYA